MDTFRALRVHAQGDNIQARLETLSINDLAPGEVVIEACFSSINYKDALAVTGKGRILRRFPLVAGVDVAGIVSATSDARFRPGDEVLVTGCGLGESHDGGFAEVVRVPADWVVPLPPGLELFDAMALGTAGFTAALAIDQMERNAQHPDAGPIVVTGASGGVGSLAIDLLSSRGYEVIALSGKADAGAWLKGLGAAAILDRNTLEAGSRPLEKAQWGGAVDNVGGDTLAWLTRSVRPWGNIASIGMAGGAELHTTVMPFILRGISILGITSANCPMQRRRKIWQRLLTDLKPRHLDRIVAGTVTLDELPAMCEKLITGQHRGRYVVDLR
ncbi:MAG: YhdH/YhfP family quinone oxidoreductase [Gammaproteobacteria bacterium]